MSYIEKEKLIKADIASIENRVRHAFNQGYDLGYKEGKANRSEIPTGSTTKNDLGVDCISRQEVLRLLANSIGKANTYLQTKVLRMPSVTPQPRKGHWIDDMSLGYHVSICSNCNWRGHGDTCLIYKPKYCPNCGAKMVALQKSEG